MNTLIILSAVGLACLFSEILHFRKALFPIVLTGLIAAFAFGLLDWNTNQRYFNDMLLLDNYAVAFSGLLILISFLWFMMSGDFFKEPSSRSDHFSLVIFALIGGVVMVSFSNMIMLFLGIEILSISLYILAGSNKSNLQSNEASLKYFLMGSFATGFLLFGIALVYGATGSFNAQDIARYLTMHPDQNNAMVQAGILMMMIALAFKVSAVPFHFWAPDVYQGSPTMVTAFMSTVVKSAAFAAFFRLFLQTFGANANTWHASLSAVAALTIIVGNLTAVYQKNFKRMLAYSSISHAGYMILAILAMNASAAGSLFYYAASYSVSSISSFAILFLVSHKTGNESIQSFNGLYRKNPFLAAMTVVAMLSLAGIPPTAGFFAKYYIFSAALQNHLTGLVLLAILGSLIGVFYYFRIIVLMFSNEESETAVPVSNSFKAFLLIATVIVLVLGIVPGIVAGLL